MLASKVVKPNDAYVAQDGFRYRLDRAIRAGFRYFRLVIDLCSDISGQFKRESIQILGSSGASLVCQVLAFGALYAYARALEGNVPLLGFAPRDSLILFAYVAGVTTLLLTAFVLLEYISNRAILSLCREYQRLGVSEALALSSSLPHWFGESDAKKISMSYERQILSSDVSHRSRMARILMRAVIPAARLIFCVAALLYLNIQFSALILVAAGIPLMGLYSVGTKIAAFGAEQEVRLNTAFTDQHDLLVGSWHDGITVPQESIPWELALGRQDSAPRLYYRRLSAKAQGQLMISAAKLLSIVTLTCALGTWVLLKPGGEWSHWITYLIALRYFLTSLTAVARAVVQSARFSRQTRRFMQFIAAARFAVNSGGPAVERCPHVVVTAYMGKAGIKDDDFGEE